MYIKSGQGGGAVQTAWSRPHLVRKALRINFCRFNACLYFNYTSEFNVTNLRSGRNFFKKTFFLQIYISLSGILYMNSSQFFKTFSNMHSIFFGQKFSWFFFNLKKIQVIFSKLRVRNPAFLRLKNYLYLYKM